jgi:Ca2+-binding RTX toxin-like protein
MERQPNMIEALEDRRLLSASILVRDGTLIVRGTRRADEIVVQGMPLPQQVISGLGPVHTTASAIPPFLVTINGRQRTINGNIRRVRVEAGAGDDSVKLSGSNTTLDFLDVKLSLPATLLGGDGNDTLVGGEAADSISGGAGCDSLDGGNGNDTLDGNANSDTLIGSSGKDLLRGGAGDDRFTMDEDDRADGGDDTDFFFRDSATGIMNPSNSAGTANMEGFLESATPAPAIRFQKGFLIAEGTRRSDFITLNYDSNTTDSVQIGVNGRVVSHIPLGGVKAIRIEGGDGDDRIEVGPESTVNAAFIPEIKPMHFPLQLAGGNGNDTLIGALGNDLLSRGAGNDELAGSDGDDTLIGGKGEDTLRGNTGRNVLLEGEHNSPDEAGPGVHPNGPNSR